MDVGHRLRQLQAVVHQESSARRSIVIISTALQVAAGVLLQCSGCVIICGRKREGERGKLTFSNCLPWPGDRQFSVKAKQAPSNSQPLDCECLRGTFRRKLLLPTTKRPPGLMRHRLRGRQKKKEVLINPKETGAEVEKKSNHPPRTVLMRTFLVSTHSSLSLL